MKKSGLFITIEGVDLSGKSTQVAYIESYLKDKGYNYITTKEPGGTPEGNLIRNVILDKNNNINSDAETLLFYTDRVLHIENKIKKYLEKGFVVVSDRFSDSTMAYQTAGGVDIEKIKTLHNICIGSFSPDLTILLDLPATEMEKRFSLRGSGKDRIELKSLQYFKKVIKAYKDLATEYPNRIKIVDASKSKEEVSKDINNILKEYI